jgi:hypothetical protein
MGTLNKRQRCPRCGGNLFLYNGLDGWYEQCLQCAHILYLDVIYDKKVSPGTGTASKTKHSTVSRM